MRTSINYSSYSGTAYYAVGKEADKVDLIFDKFIKAVEKYPELKAYEESKTEDSIMYRIPSDATHVQLLVNKIAMICYEGCVYNNEKSCKKCAYKGYCDIINGKEV